MIFAAAGQHMWWARGKREGSSIYSPRRPLDGFLYTSARDIRGNLIFMQIKGKVPRGQFNLTDHAFRLRTQVFDCCLKFRWEKEERMNCMNLVLTAQEFTEDLVRIMRIGMSRCDISYVPVDMCVVCPYMGGVGGVSPWEGESR